MSEIVRTPSTPTAAGPVPASASASTGSGTGDGGKLASSVVVTNPGPELTKLVVGQTLDAVVVKSDQDGRTQLAIGTTRMLLHVKPPPGEGTVIRFQVATATPLITLTLLNENLLVRPHAHILANRPPRQQATVGQVLNGHFSPSALHSVAPVGPHLMSADSPTRAYAANAIASAGPSSSGPLSFDGKVAVRIAAIHADPNGSRPSISQGSTTITGEVSTDPRGTTTVSTGLGKFTFDRPMGLPDGTRVDLQLISGPTRPAQAPATHQSPILATTHLWDEFQAAVQKIVATASVAAPVSPALPKADPRLLSAIVLFLNAVYGGRLLDWLGREPVELLRQRQPRLLAQLAEGFGQLGRSAGEPIQSDWRLIHLPFLNGVAVEPLRLFLRQHADEESEGGAAERGGLRFVLEAELSRLGLIQLDGLVRAREFDLAVRSARSLPTSLQTEIKAIFTKAGVEADFSGKLEFVPAPVVLQTDVHEPAMRTSGIVA